MGRRSTPGDVDPAQFYGHRASGGVPTVVKLGVFGLFRIRIDEAGVHVRTGAGPSTRTWAEIADVLVHPMADGSEQVVFVGHDDVGRAVGPVTDAAAFVAQARPYLISAVVAPPEPLCVEPPPVEIGGRADLELGLLAGFPTAIVLGSVVIALAAGSPIALVLALAVPIWLARPLSAWRRQPTTILVSEAGVHLAGSEVPHVAMADVRRFAVVRSDLVARRGNVALGGGVLLVRTTDGATHWFDMRHTSDPKRDRLLARRLDEVRRRAQGEPVVPSSPTAPAPRCIPFAAPTRPNPPWDRRILAGVAAMCVLLVGASIATGGMAGAARKGHEDRSVLVDGRLTAIGTMGSERQVGLVAVDRPTGTDVVEIGLAAGDLETHRVPVRYDPSEPAVVWRDGAMVPGTIAPWLFLGPAAAGLSAGGFVTLRRRWRRAPESHLRSSRSRLG